MKVVSNAGPLIALSKLSILPVLKQLYGVVQIPSAVYDEVVIRGLETSQPDAQAVQLAIARNELIVSTLADTDLSESYWTLPLGKGEKQAIYLSLKEKADWVLLDDLLAREEAQRLNLKTKGTLGIIVEAYHQNLLTLKEVEIVFQVIEQQDDIWISAALVKHVWQGLQKQ
jgi:predicted nucleic acid-binding protein